MGFGAHRRSRAFEARTELIDPEQCSAAELMRWQRAIADQLIELGSADTEIADGIVDVYVFSIIDHRSASPTFAHALVFGSDRD